MDTNVEKLKDELNKYKSLYADEVQKRIELINLINEKEKKDDKKENQDVNANDIIRMLEKLKRINGNQIVIVETPKGTASLKLKDALIYEGCVGEIVLDSE